MSNKTQILDDLIENIVDTGIWTSTSTKITIPTSDTGEQAAVKALQQIIDCDRMSSDEYEKKYGKDVDYDPYVIAKKAMERINES